MKQSAALAVLAQQARNNACHFPHIIPIEKTGAVYNCNAPLLYDKFGITVKTMFSLNEFLRRPYIPLTRIFTDVAEYNNHKPRHPLPDPNAELGKWETNYKGNENATQLPDDLTEEDARAFIMGLSRFHDYMEREQQTRDGIYRKILAHLFTPQAMNPEAKNKVHSILEHKTIGHLTVYESQIAEYIAASILNNGASVKELKEKLAEIGITAEPFRNKIGLINFVFYNMDEEAKLEELSAAIENIDNASYLGALMAAVHMSKPQYTQSLMLFTEDAIQRSKTLIPAAEQEFDALLQAYKDTGLEAAVNKMRELTTLTRQNPQPVTARPSGNNSHTLSA